MPRGKQAKNAAGQRDAGKREEARGKRTSETPKSMDNMGRGATASRGQKNRGRG